MTDPTTTAAAPGTGVGMSEGTADAPRGTPVGPAGASADGVSATAGPAPAIDLGRRSFFRRVAGELVQGAASLSGVATAAHSAMTGVEAATREIAGPDGTAAAGTRAGEEPEVAASRAADQAARARLRTRVAPWTVDGERLLLLDARRLPGTVATFPVASAAEAARAIADRAVIGPSAAAVAAWGWALSVDAAARHVPATRDALVAGAERSLLAADPGSAVLAWGMASLRERVAAGVAPRDAAGALIAYLGEGHGRVAGAAAQLLATLDDRPVLVHGASGAIWGAGAGTALEAALLRGGEVLLTETRPWLDGARIGAWEAERRGVGASVLPDAAGPGIVAVGRIGAVVVAADRVAPDGSVAVEAGGYGLALAAARHAVPFIVVAASWSVAAPAAPTEARLAGGAIEQVGGLRVAPPGSAAVVDRFDRVPPDLVTRLVVGP